MAATGLDEFDQWCTARDRREDQSPSARYVSREIPGYDDFDQYGQWGNQPGYGQVWMPNNVAGGWAPYHDGTWVWVDPWGWTWVDEAPWGFAPYHYGRWASFGGRWGWIPGPMNVTPVYAPALVAWIGGGPGGSGFSMSFAIGTAAAVGWFPLGPREPFYPSYQASQGYFARVNRSNTYFDDAAINNYYSRRNSGDRGVPYVNQRVRNGVTAVPQNRFASGQRVNQFARPVPDAQLGQVRVIGAPPIAPLRQSVLGPRADTAGKAGRPTANGLSRPVVARTSPPPPPVPFDRQQGALAKQPGVPLPQSEVRQIRQNAPVPAAPVRVVDMGRVKRVQPAVGEPPRPLPNVGPGPERKGQASPRPEIQQQQQRQQQEAQRQQPQKQQQDVQRQQQQKQDVQQQQLRQQQEAQRQQQQKQQQDIQRQRERNNTPPPQAQKPQLPPGPPPQAGPGKPEPGRKEEPPRKKDN
jgi:hypothetical protein